MKPYIFPKSDRILKRYEFLAFYSRGKAVHSQGFILVFKQGQFVRSRIGITVSRKVGSAVTRNRIKRRVREFYRHRRMAVPVNWDFHVIAKKPAASLSSRQTIIMLEWLFDRFQKAAVSAGQPFPAAMPQ